MFNKLQLGTQPAAMLSKARLNKAGALVLLKMMYHINRVNIVEGTPADVAKMAGVTIGDFHVGVRSLKQTDFIRKYTKKEYMLNPDIMFNGNDRQYFIVKHMWDTQTSKGLRK